MSRHTHGRSARPEPNNLRAMRRKVETELAQGYVEIEAEGLTLQRLFCIYATFAQAASQRAFHGMRSLFRLHPAH